MADLDAEPDDGDTGVTGLARQIRGAVDRFVADDAADPASLAAALDALPRQELAAMARVAFDGLSPVQQWAVLERTLGDSATVDSLAEEQRGRLAGLRAQVQSAATAAAAVQRGAVSLAAIPAGSELRLGMFRPSDVRAAAGRGRRSDVCARELTLLATSVAGRFRVLGDEFNPRGGLFVSGDYDLDVWESERLDSNSVVDVGSLEGEDASSLDPVLRHGARVDVVVSGVAAPGRLHLGWATIDDVDVFPLRRSD
ncbi:MAG TPA: hypothetical protein PLS63_06835 [Microthrixaceae bacterium]|jgi:hypothetical protein|nr:hypothetical protein [Microthrixaceae bacterium]